MDQVLGQGASAVVYSVVDQSTSRRLALKQLLVPKDEHLGEALRLRFRREFYTLATLRDPHIVEVYDFGVDNKSLYYTMELLDGEQLMESDEPLGSRQVCRIIHDIASALAFLHSRRLIHSDISRRNIGWTPDGRSKLLDFGLLATVGIHGQGRGTPPYMAPEVQRGLPLDHRTDLFSLGVLAYTLLTNKKPFAIRDGSDNKTRTVWTDRPTPPRQLEAETSKDLSDLVISMLSVDPLGRPTSAAEVIDRVRGIAGIAQAPEVEVVRGYLASTALIGREPEMKRLRQALTFTKQGRGLAVLIEAPSGMGKSRVLRELAVEAQLAGVRVLSARGDTADRGPYSVLHELVQALLASCDPEPDGLTTVRRADAALAAINNWLESGVGPDLKDPAQERLVLQRKLVERILAEADRRPVVLLVDDLQRCDEASAAVLASIAYQAQSHRILLVATLRTDERILAQRPVAGVKQYSQSIRLKGLVAKEVQQLVRAIFGDVDHVERLAGWIHDASGGSPLRCTELARYLVEQGRVSYEDGTWRIPENLGPVEIPCDLVAAMEARVDSLGLQARELGEALSIHGGELSLELCVELAEVEGEDEAFAVIDELVQQEVLIGEGERLRFRHDGLREALLRNLSAKRRRALHLRVGQMLESRQPNGGCEEEIGWHLLEGGEELRGAELLERAGMRQIEAQSFSDAIGPLEAALRVFERVRASPRRCCELRQYLVRAGTVANREVALRHGDAVISELWRYSGQRLAERIRRYIGGHLSLGISLLVTWIRWLMAPKERRGVPPREALIRFVTMVNYIAAVKALSFDLEGLRALPPLIEPVCSLSKKWMAYVSYLLCISYELILTGRWRQLQEAAAHYFEIRRNGRLWYKPSLVSDLDLSLGDGAMRYMVAMIQAHDLSPRCLEHFEKLEAMDLHFFEVSAKQGRVMYHRLRGEEQRAREIEAETKLLLLQMGSMWLWEAVVTWYSSLAYCATRDLPALRRSIDELERLAAEGMQVEPILAMARGIYQQERGQHEEARQTFSELYLSDHSKDNQMIKQAAINGLAWTLLALGEFGRVASLARQGVALGKDPETSVIPLYIFNNSNLALAEAAIGNHESAALRIDRMLCAVEDHPLFCGTLHERRTLVALAADDLPRARHHLGEMEFWFRSTNNPALVARYEKLAALVNQQQRQGTRSGEPEEISQELETLSWNAA